jgi:uncharacterized protein YwqG
MDAGVKQMLTRERMRELIEEHGLSDRADEIMADMRPSIHLTLRYDVEEADIPVGASKMGGSPDVPADFEWPTWNDQYLSFIAQIRLSDAKPFDLEGLLPETGILYFFYENFQFLESNSWSQASGPYKTIYVSDETIPLQQMTHPISVYQYVDNWFNEPWSQQTEVYTACLIEFEQEWTELVSHKTSFPPVNGQKWGFWNVIYHELAQPMHRLLGVENDIQGHNDMMERASELSKRGTPEDWTLLAQFDSGYSGHTKPGFQWVDDGLIYFWIHKDDLKIRRFDRIWLNLLFY